MTDRELLVSIQSQIAAQLGTPVIPPVDPPIKPPVSPPGPYVASGMWVYPNNRQNTGTLKRDQQGPSWPFTIPSGWKGVVEFPVSGANINIWVDGVLTSSDGRSMEPGPHTVGVTCGSGSAEAMGTIAVVHTP